MNILDLIVIVVIAVIAIVSARKGFLIQILNIASYVISGIFARIFSTPVVSYLYTNYFSEKVLMKLHEVLPSGSVEGEIGKVVVDTLEALPEFIAAAINHFNLFDLSLITDEGSLTVEMLEQTYLAPMISKVLSIIVIVALFILFAIVLKFVFSIINRLLTGKKHKLIRGTNMFFGAALGAVKGSLTAGIICAVLNIAAPAINNPQLLEYVNGSAICGIIADLLK